VKCEALFIPLRNVEQKLLFETVSSIFGNFMKYFLLLETVSSIFGNFYEVFLILTLGHI
jgi:hypothetical protein